jgi:hypothetical protein
MISVRQFIACCSDESCKGEAFFVQSAFDLAGSAMPRRMHVIQENMTLRAILA